MIGCYDFCGHYEWTFGWLDRNGGHELVRAYWNEAINNDSQRHARELITQEGFAGMAQYWGHTLLEESPEMGFKITQLADVFRVDMHACPSKGFLIRNKLEQYHDYCDHCIGWIGPMLKEAGFTIDHQHNHCGQCWWEMRRAKSEGGLPPVGQTSGDKDVRIGSNWRPPGTKIDSFNKTNDLDDKIVTKSGD